MLNLQMEHASAHFDYDSADSVIASFAEAVTNLTQVERSGGTIAWSTLSVHIDVATISESRITERYNRVHAGRSTVTVDADVIYEVT